MKAALKAQMDEYIKCHGETLLSMFPEAKEKDPVKLYKKLRHLETKAHQLAENVCNRGRCEAHDVEQCRLGRRVADLLGKERLDACDFFINTDPRGYALKLTTCPPTLHRDWGGFGILAPDFTPED